MVAEHSGETTMLDRILWTIMVVPFLTLIVLMLYARLRPVLGSLHKYGSWWPKALLIGQQLVKDDKRPMHFHLLRIAGFLAFVVVGGKWILYWWPAGPEAAQEVGLLFILNLIIILIYLLIIVVATVTTWREVDSPAKEPWEFIYSLVDRLFIPEDWDFPIELILWILLLLPTAINTLCGWSDASSVKTSVAYASTNHHAEVTQDPRKIIKVRLNDLTRTLCLRAMNGFGNKFAEEGAKNPYHAQYYAKCVVLIQRPIPKK